MIKKLLPALFFTLVNAIGFGQYLSPVYPGNEQIVPDNDIDFSWNTHPIADNYDIIITSDANATNVLFDENHLINQANYAITNYDTCYWFIKAYSGTNLVSYSDTSVFYIYSPKVLPGLQLWLDPDSVTKDGSDNVSAWNDRSPNHYTFVQENPGEQPVFNSNVLNGHPGVIFDGSDWLNGGDVLDVNYSESWSIFIVGVSNASTGAFFAKSAAGPFNNRYSIFYEGSLKFMFVGAADLTSSQTAPINQFHVITAHVNRQSPYFQYRIDGVLKAQGTSVSPATYNFNSTFRFLIGAYSNSTDTDEILLLNGKIAEIIMYNQLNLQQSLFVENMLRYKYYPAQYSEPIELGYDIFVNNGFCDTLIDAGTGFSSYVWNTGATDQSITVNQSGLYSVTVTDSYGMESTDAIRVFYPSINTPFQDTTICLGDTIHWNTGLSSNYDFLWEGSTSTDSTIDIWLPGTYNVTVSDSEGCSTSSIEIEVFVDNFAEQVNLGEDRSECNGAMLELISPPSGINSYLWHTGSGDSSIPVESDGDYSISVTNNRGCIGIDTVIITVSGYAPNIQFNADTVCIGVPTSFENLTTVPDPFEVAIWLWDFGNSNTSDVENPQFTFSETGTHTVSLYAETDAGCNNYFEKDILIYDSPTSNFEVEYGNTHCLGTEIQFFNTSISPNIENYIWSFGDDSESTEQNPIHTYNNNGSFNVWLKVTNNNGCSDSIMQTITISDDFENPEAFSLVYPNNGFQFSAPMEETTFQWNESANSSYYLFQVATDMDFNNIVYSEAVYNTSVNYSLPETGYYFWRVFALNICQAEIISDTYSMSLNLPEPNDVNLWLNAASENLFLNGDKVAMWHNSVPYSYAAMQPIEIKQPTYILADSCINFQPSIKFSDSYLNLGNVLPLDSIREIFIFAKYDSFGNYPYIFSKGAGGNGAIALNSFQDTSLLRIYTDNIIQNSDWCYPTQKYFLINIQYFSQDSLVVYANNQMILNIDVDVDFLGNSTYDFILGNTAYQSFNNPFYGNIAEFIVADSTLTEQNRDELYNYFHFKYSPPVNLGSDIRIAYNLCDTTITTANRAWFTEFLWSTGDTTPTITIPSSGTGTYSVTTTDIFGYTSSDEIYVEFPFTLAEFNDETICQGDEIIWDADVNNIDYTYSWFGSSETSPILTISEQGEYAVIISDSLGCSYHSDTAFINVDPYTLTASIGPADTTMCSGNSLSLVTNIEETQLYNWSTGSTEPEITITEPGTYNVTVTNTNSCTATDQINVNLQGIAPIADYNYTGSCVMNPILFTDNSTTGSGNIEEWQWYANGTPIGTGNTFEYTFTETGAHIVSLEVTTDEGCSNEVESIIEVSPLPVPDFLPAKACTGNIVDFMSLSNIAVGGITHIDWDFGSGYEQTGEHALFTWENPGSYPIKIKVTSNAGCIDSLESNILVREAPSAIFTTSNACAGYPVYFVNQTEHLPLWPITNYHWILDEDVETGKSDPIHTYDTPGVYPIELAVIALNGCTDTAKISLNVNPIPEADFVNTDACPNIAHTIINNSTISSGTIESNTWVIDSIGTLYSPNAEVQFTDTGSYQTLLIVESNGGCLDTVSKPLIVHPNPLAQFSPDPVWGSVPLEVEFYNDSEGATSYQWIFGDGNESTDIQPVHTFGLEGDYQVELVAESIFGCLDNTLTNIRVIIPAMDIILLNFTTNINNGYLEASVDIVNAGTLPAIDMELVLTAGENNTYREIIYDSFNPGEIIHHVFNAQFFLANDELPPYVCVEAFPGDYEGHTDMNLNDNSICVTNSGSLLVYMPRPNPAINEINFSFVNAEANNTILEIVSATGQKIYFNNFDNLAAGYHTYNIDISSYASGLYTIILTTGEVTENRQFIKE